MVESQKNGAPVTKGIECRFEIGQEDDGVVYMNLPNNAGHVHFSPEDARRLAMTLLNAATGVDGLICDAISCQVASKRERDQKPVSPTNSANDEWPEHVGVINEASDHSH